MPHGTRFQTLVRALAFAALAAGPGMVMANAPAAPAPPTGAGEPPTVDPDATDRELICRMLKLLGKPCPPADFPSYEDYYAQVEQAWGAFDPDALDPLQRDELLAAALAVEDCQTPAPAGVDPVAYDNFMLVLDEIIYEMGG